VNVYLESLGCRLNQSEIETLAQQFSAAGDVVVDSARAADVCILNTCAVTSAAGRKSRRQIRALARDCPRARIAVIGCYATLAPRRCAESPNVAWVIPNERKGQIARELASTAPPCADVHARPPARTRASVKVQDGCDQHCTYCIVRLLRGRSRSRTMTEIVAEIQALTSVGCREVVLTGACLGAYGRDLGDGVGLRALIETLLRRTETPRLRLSSLEPWDLDAAFFDLWENPRLCRQLHLPLQSGCDETLRRMGRRTDVDAFARLVETARAAIPDLAVTTDVMVGFPGESEADFQASYAFVAEMAFARLHVFPYSPRPGTPAARLPGQVRRRERRARSQAMRRLGSELAACFRRRFIGREMDVLWEHRRDDGAWPGLTDNYVRVLNDANDANDAKGTEAYLFNQITKTRLIGERNGRLLGEVVR
jgi:threonylcarbamoyladenosine tRNA methylthiotransferase MtaB